MGGRYRWLARLIAIVALIFFTACTREIIKEVQVVATPTSVPTTATAEPVTQTEGEKVYQLGIFADLTTTNFWSYLGSSSDGTIWNAYVLGGAQPALYGYSDQRFDWVPSLAAGFPSPLLEETIGGQTFWTTEVDLKEGFLWSDGSEVTAADFVFTTQTVLDLELTASWASSVNPEFFDHAEAPGPSRLKLFFKQKPGLAVWQFGTAFMPIMSQNYWGPVVEKVKQQGDIIDQQKALFAHLPSGQPAAGGYTFKKWERGAFAEIVRNPEYYFTGATITEYENGAYAESRADGYRFSAYGEPSGGKSLEYIIGPYADSTIYSIYGTQEAAILALRKGDIDLILNPIGLQRGLQDQVKGQSGIAVIENPSNGFRYLGFNVRRAPMSDKSFRHAVATLIDKEFLASTVLQGVAIPMYTTVPEGNGFWYNPEVPLIGKGLSRTERVTQAVELLRGAGYTWETEPEVSEDGAFMKERGKGLKMPDGQPVPELEILAPSAGYDPLRSTFAIWIERWLNDIGIPVRANLTGFNIIVERITDPEGFDMWILGWSLSLYPDYLEAFFHSRNALGEGLNRGGYSNPEFDKLADELLAETDLEAARRHVFKMQEFLADDLPYVVLFTTPVLEAYRDDRLEFPYTEVLSGIQDQNALTTTVLIK
ncbi:MAG: ABC transporter substrate-binding protein [Chloroflexi bacterium]|nr:ABC transporter substrate-binding protein [Chloroflexota bacterium]